MVKYEVEWLDSAAEILADPPQPEFCETCGRRLVYEVGWGDLDGLDDIPDPGGLEPGGGP